MESALGDTAESAEPCVDKPSVGELVKANSIKLEASAIEIPIEAVGADIQAIDVKVVDMPPRSWWRWRS